MLNQPHTMDIYGTSNIGLVRETNQDIWAALPERGLYLVADGMGGHAGGEVAAQEAVAYFQSLEKGWSPSSQMTPDEALILVKEALDATNRHVYSMGRDDARLKGMGTTLTVLYFLSGHAVIGHVGDSRIYRLRAHELNRLTEDHSLVSELIAMGAMKPEDAEHFPFKHILTRAIGTHPIVEGTVNFVSIESKDLFLLCSDGLTNFVSDETLGQILYEEGPLEEKGETLVQRALENGGADNITLVLVEIQ